MKRKNMLGDIFQIPLPNGRYAYGRKFKDGCIAIYKELSDVPRQVPQKEDYQFVVGVYDDVLKKGEWEVVDHRSFNNEDEAWPPPMCIIDSISGKYKIYHRGEITAASESQCVNLEIAAVWEAEHIVDRIMGIDIWHTRK